MKSFFRNVKKARNIKNKRRDDDQSIKKNILLNVLIKFKFYKNCRDSNFISENDFD